ncbi:MAG: hypothetical protein QG670_290 [Thermoproteota archaeon]|nr:hypothetical protein [Thermoproteota archaeon]
MKSIENRVQQSISKQNMFKPDDKISLALSGGKDSVSLLHILSKIEGRFPKTKLVAVTIDEGILGYREEAIRIAEENCGRLGVEHNIFSFKELFGSNLDEIIKAAEKLESELSFCSYCGVLRRRALNIAARKVEATKLAMAHNLDDEVQSMLMNLLRGDISRASRKEPAIIESEPAFIQRVKPLCEVLEREVAFYAFLKRIKFQTILCPYLESSIRQDVRLFLNQMEGKHNGMKFAVYRTFKKLQQRLDSFDNKDQFRFCEVCGEPTTGRVCRVCQLLEELRLNNKE